LLLAVPLLFAMFCFWQALPDSVTSPQSAQALTATASIQSERQLVTRRIDEIQPGHRVLAEDPDVEDGQPDTQIIPEKWSLISLQLSKEDESEVFVELLRPTKYLTSIHATVGESIWIDLPEMGVSGAATVLNVSSCPEIETGEGRIVTGTFRHTSGDIIDLQIEGQQSAISCTGNHPFWSEDRQEFVEANKLQQGEQLRQTDGSLTRLVSITSRESQVDVYNLEVDIDHTYFVGVTGILVHNNYLTRFGNGPESAADLAKHAQAARNAGFPHGVSTRLSNYADGRHRNALLKDVREHFNITQTGKNPQHHTVELPDPVTDGVADLFNSLFFPK
jgi:hypothetical protein